MSWQLGFWIWIIFHLLDAFLKDSEDENEAETILVTCGDFSCKQAHSDKVSQQHHSRVYSWDSEPSKVHLPVTSHRSANAKMRGSGGGASATGSAASWSGFLDSGDSRYELTSPMVTHPLCCSGSHFRNHTVKLVLPLT